MSKEKSKKEAKKLEIVKDKEVKTSRTDIERISGTVIPIVFRDFVETMEKYGEVKHKSSVSVFSDKEGTFFSIPKLGSTSNKIALFLNRSKGWKPQEEYDCVKIGTWHTGDVRVIVTNDSKSMKQAIKICKEWKSSRSEFFSTREIKTEKENKGNGVIKKSKKEKYSEAEANA